MRKLYRSTRDRKLFGVCAGLADYLGVDATLLRILLVIVTVFSGGTVLFVYIIAGFIIPRDSDFGGGSTFGGPQAGHGGWAPPPQHGGWAPPQQRPPAPPASSWNSGTAWPGPGPAAPAARPAPQTAAPASQASSTLDAMMEDIEKKALKKEIEELKARITKFEQQSKGE